MLPPSHPNPHTPSFYASGYSPWLLVSKEFLTIQVVLVVIVIVVINILQNKAPKVLPSFLKSWNWAPIWLRSLEPYDRVVQKIIRFVRQNLCCCKKKTENEHRVNHDSFQNGSSKPPSYSDDEKGKVNESYRMSTHL